MTNNYQLPLAATVTYQCFVYIFIAVTLLIAIIVQIEAHKNKFAEWSPHAQFTLYLLGISITMIAFALGWYSSPSISQWELPIFFIGEGVNMTSLLIVCNKMMQMVKWNCKLQLPIFICNMNNLSAKQQKMIFYFYWIMIFSPSLALGILAVVDIACDGNKPFKIVISALESIYSIYLVSLIIVTVVHYNKQCKNSETQIANLIKVLAICSIIDCFLTQIVFLIVSLVVDVQNIYSEFVTVLAYIKDWVIFSMYCCIDYVVISIQLKIKKQIQQLRLESQEIISSKLDDSDL